MPAEQCDALSVRSVSLDLVHRQICFRGLYLYCMANISGKTEKCKQRMHKNANLFTSLLKKFTLLLFCAGIIDIRETGWLPTWRILRLLFTR